MKLLNGRILFALLFVVVFAILIVTAMGYNTWAKLFPLIVAIPVFIATVANLVIDVRAELRGEKPGKAEGHSKAPPVASVRATRAPAAAVEPAAGAAQQQASPAGPGTSVANRPAPAAFTRPAKEKKEKISGPEKRKRELIGIAWLIGYVVAIAVFGFPLATVGYMIAFVKLYNHESWKLTIAYTVLLSVFIWITFVVLLKSNLYSGMLFDWLGL